MTILQMHDMVKDLKNQGQGGYDPPEVIDRALNNGSNDKFNQEKMLFEAISRIADNLAPFKTDSTITFTSGFGNLPGNYGYRTNASTLSDPPKQVEIVPESEWINRQDDPVDPPSETYPICAIRTQIEVIPHSVAQIRLFYLRKPVTMLFSYTPDSNGNEVQNVGASVDCDWPSDAQPDIVLRALPYLGVPLSEDLLIRFKAYKAQTEAV